MTVSRTDNKAKFNCNGSTYQFAFEFPVQDDDDVVVVLIDSSGGETVLTKGTHYAIAESDSGWSGGGTVTTQTSGESGMENYSYASGYSILLYRSVPLTQLLDLYTGRNIDLQDLEDAFDKMQMQVIDLQRQLDRCIKVPDQDTSPTTLIANAASRANKFIAFDADGDAQASSGPVTGVTPTTFAESLLGAADAEEARDLLECADLLDTFTVVTTTPYSCDGTEKTIIVNSGSAVTLNLATLSAYGDGANLRIFNIGAGAVTVDASGTETIMGALTISLVQNMGILLVARTASGWTAVGVPALSISEAMIADLAVTEGKIGALAVTEGKIGSAAVTNAKLGTGSVTSEKIADNSVSTGKIQNNAISPSKLGAGVSNPIVFAPSTTITAGSPSCIDVQGLTQSYQTVWQCYLYIPDGVKYVILAGRIRGGSGSQTVYLRLNVNGTTGAVVSAVGMSFANVSSSALDISGQAGAMRSVTIEAYSAASATVMLSIAFLVVQFYGA